MTQKVQVIIFSPNESGLRILLFKRAKDSSWQPVTGGVDDGEAIIDAAYREVREESGLDAPLRVISDIRTFSFINPPTHRRAGPVTEYVYAFEASSDFVPVISSEHTESKWFTVDKAMELLPTDDQRKALSRLEEILSK